MLSHQSGTGTQEDIRSDNAAKKRSVSLDRALQTFTLQPDHKLFDANVDLTQTGRLTPLRFE